MLFLIRTAFWLMIVVLLVPTDGQQNSQVYGTAEAAVKDVASFCDRNPDACAKGKDAFGVLVHKAEFGARMLMDMISNRVGTVVDDNVTTNDPALMPLEPAGWETSASQDTLKTEDREVAWGGPDDAGI